MAVTACPTASRTGRTVTLLAAFTASLLIVLGALVAEPAHATSACSLYVAPGGSDGALGSIDQPFASVQRLAEALTPGQTGCVRGGTYSQDVTVTSSGRPGAPITITSYPGERATLVGRLWIHAGADYVTVSDLNLDGRNAGNLPSPDINAANATFTGDEVTDDHTAICFDIGSDTSYGRATNTVIQGNRIHDCGQLPAANHDHGIYVESSTGAQILENVIYGNADRGIQLYPDAQQTRIEHNIIDSNGEGVIFSGDFGLASSNNTVADNLITNSTLRAEVESWYPTGNPIGQSNTVEGNCVWGGVTGTIREEVGFTATGNTVADPDYANAAAGDYRINSASPCAALLGGTSTPTQPFTTTSSLTYAGGPIPVAKPTAGPTTSPSGAKAPAKKPAKKRARRHHRAEGRARIASVRSHHRRHHRHHRPRRKPTGV